MKRILAIVAVCFFCGCAAPTLCPKEDMVLFVPALGVPVVVPKGIFNSPDAETKKEFDARMKEYMKKHGLACRG